MSEHESNCGAEAESVSVVEGVPVETAAVLQETEDRAGAGITPGTSLVVEKALPDDLENYLVLEHLSACGLIVAS